MRHLTSARHRVLGGQAQLALSLVLALLAPAAVSARAPAASPDPGGNENAQLTGPPAGKVLGFAGVQQVGSLAPRVAARHVAKTGGNMTRTAMHWQALEPARR